MRPDKYLRPVLVVRRQGATPMTGIRLYAVRRPDGTAHGDERGAVTSSERAPGSGVLAARVVELMDGGRGTVGILGGDHRVICEGREAAARARAGGLVVVAVCAFA